MLIIKKLVEYYRLFNNLIIEKNNLNRLQVNKLFQI